jgi:carbon-monoxide dehydrogenase medium subunit
MYDFAYRRPQSLADAAAAIAADDEATVIAGGQTLLPVLRARLAMPSTLVDLGRLDELKGIRAEGDQIIIGAGEQHAEVAANSLVREALPGVAALAGGIGDPQVRHRGTIGGSIANNDPSACYPSSALALDAAIVTTRRILPAADFFTGMYATALQRGELVKAVSYPQSPRCVYVKFPNPASRFALIGVFAAVVGGRTRLAITGGGAGVFRWTAAETYVDGGGPAPGVATLDMDLDLLTSDLHGSAEYRRQIARTVAARALAMLAALG